MPQLRLHASSRLWADNPDESGTAVAAIRSRTTFVRLQAGYAVRERGVSISAEGDQRHEDDERARGHLLTKITLEAAAQSSRTPAASST